MPDSILLQNITFTYAVASKPALRQIALEVPAGQICGVVGRAGAGKSTLCALCAGFIPDFYRGTLCGSAHVAGQDVVRQPVAELVRHVGLVGSNPFSQISGARFTVYEEIGFGLENLGLPRAEIVARIEWALHMLQLADLRHQSPYTLSGGQQQRVVLAAALAMQPPVLILDEPTAQLDPLAARDLTGILRDLNRQGTTLLFAEHRLEWAAEFAARIVVLDDGRIVADGPPEAVFTDSALRDRGIGWPRPALLADRARRQGYWPAAVPLAVTREQLLTGLRATAGERTGSSTSGRSRTSSNALDHNGVYAPIVQVENIHFSYTRDVRALRGVSMRMHAGERVALLGRNGAGKSTLVRHLNGLLRPTNGRVRVAGEETTRTSVSRCAQHVGIVFQDIRNQFFARTVRDELSFGPRNLGFSPARVVALVDQALQSLDLVSVAAEHPYDLSMARRRLVAIAAVLTMDTPLLVLDEPTAGLDTAGMQLLTRLIHNLVAQGKSVLVASHDLDFCFEALDRVILLRTGQILLDSPWDNLDDSALTVLAAEVGLPLGLQAIRALGVSRDTGIAALLTSP